MLNGQQDPAIRPVSNDFAVFALSRDLGTIKATQTPVVWAVGYTTDPTISYTDLSGAPPTSRVPYYKTQYQSDDELASIDTTSCGDDVFNNKSRSSTFSKITVMRSQELEIWTTRYCRLPTLSRIILETWPLPRSPKYSAVCS